MCRELFCSCISLQFHLLLKTFVINIAEKVITSRIEVVIQLEEGRLNEYI